MARIAGRNGRIYAAITSAGTPEPITFMNNWSINFVSDKIETTAFGDTGKTYVAGLPDASGDYAGFYDDGTTQFYTAATDGIARRFYLYPSTLTTTQYWHGYAIFDFSVSAAVDGAVAVSGSWAATSAILKAG